MAQKVAVAAAQKVWAGMINKDSPENGQLVKTITNSYLFLLVKKLMSNYLLDE